MHPHTTRWLTLIAAVAVLHALFFIYYQRPVWDTTWEDQVGYQRLGHVFATTGTFTRYPDARPFVPETIRTPGYPVFVAATYRLFGESHTAVAVAQALLFAALTLVVYGITTRIASERVGLAAAGFTAIFPPIPYYGALVLTEVLCTLLVTLAMWAAIRAIQTSRARDYIVSGVLLGCATLVRPNFALLPAAIAGCVALVAILRREWPRAWPWLLTLAAYAIVLT